jgi:hypothetical protein
MSYYNPTKQTKFGKKGNCLSAVVSTLFDVGIEDIPVFADDEEHWTVELSTWMSKNFGKFVCPMKLSCQEDFFIFCGSLMITGINSPHPNVERHAVITKGDKVVFDPMIGECNYQLTNDMDATFMVVGDVRRIANQRIEWTAKTAAAHA